MKTQLGFKYSYVSCQYVSCTDFKVLEDQMDLNFEKSQI